ncbi:MAG: serine/threonine-protein kinase [Desulfobacteraceae bacterium]|jgi:serine/threonine-protein kinase
MIKTTIGNYKLTGIIAKGGMGAVYYGEDIALKRPVAIKAVRPEILDKPYALERFQAEAITTAKLNHPNIATVYGLIEHDGAQFLIMEYVKGWTLSQILRICNPLSPVQAIWIIKFALAGIEHAHQQGVIHRDLKPTNLMLNENALVKVMDFGIARVIDGPNYTQTGQLIGTLKYMPPEQIKGGQLDPRTDIYALGTVLYKLLTGRSPFAAKSDYEIMMAQVEETPLPLKTFSDRISEVLQSIVLKTLSKSMEDRFDGTEAFSEALSQCPEFKNADSKDLKQLVDLMQKKHPPTINPLNKEGLDALYGSSQLALNSKSFSLSIPSVLTNAVQHTILEVSQLIKQPTRLYWRGIFVISFFLFILSVFIFILSSWNSTERNVDIPHSQNNIQHTETINDEKSDYQKDDISPKEPLESIDQQEQKKWIIER